MSIIEWINRRTEKWKENRCEECGKKLVCLKCGSENVKPAGWDGINHRHYCSDCGVEDWL